MDGRIFIGAIILACCGSPDGIPVVVPSGAPGIGFDDLRYSPTLGRVLAPAGRAGSVAVIDPDALAVATVGGFSSSTGYDGGHDFGPTSVDEGRGLLFVTDRTSQRLTAVDPEGGIMSSVGLAASPDYVRYVAATDEPWVTEPSASQIEVFSAASLRSLTTIPVANGPESLVIDQRAGRAYTHRWQAQTVVLDVVTRSPVAEWPNGCAASRALRSTRSVASSSRSAWKGRSLCSTPRTAAAPCRRSHAARATTSSATNPKLGHIYLAGTVCSCLVVLGVSSAGELSFLGRFEATGSAHCAAADDRGHAWICDPDGGRLLRVDDPYPASW